MIQYNVEEIADSLMLSSSELKEILDIYFEETVELLLDCQNAIARHDSTALAKTFHALKGSSSNLKIITVAELAAKLETLAKSDGETNFADYLPKIQSEIDSIKEYIDTYYANIEE